MPPGLLPVVIFPDVELWACDYLREQLDDRAESYADGVYVSNVVPTPRRDRMVIVRRDGGPRLDATREQPALTVRVWATSEQESTDLSRLIGALLWAAPTGQPVISVTQTTGPTPVPDDSEQPLRMLTFELIVRGT